MAVKSNVKAPRLKSSCESAGDGKREDAILITVIELWAWKPVPRALTERHVGDERNGVGAAAAAAKAAGMRRVGHDTRRIKRSLRNDRDSCEGLASRSCSLPRPQKKRPASPRVSRFSAIFAWGEDYIMS
jgi:hypothetical protein